MKKLLLSFVLGCAVCAMANAQVGTLKTGTGQLFDETRFKVVKKAFQKGEAMPRHNHEGYTLVLTVVKGQINVTLNGTEKYQVHVGDVLHFDGRDYIESEPVSEASEILVTLVKDGKTETKTGEHQH